MTTHLITRAELATLAGVSRPAVTKATRPDGPLRDAVSGRKINARHPLVMEWLARKGVTSLPAPDAATPPPAEQRRKPPRVPTTPAGSAPADAPPPDPGTPDLDGLEDMTLREVVMRYGSVDGFKRFVDTLKAISDYQFREQRVRRERGELIERETVAGVVFPLLDLTYKRLVTDVPDALAPQIQARAESGGPDALAEIGAMIREANSRVLKGVKEQLVRKARLTS